MDPSAPADRIFLGGSILTMERGNERVEAVAVAGGRILAAGSRREVLAHRGPGTEVTELGERALLPAFIDGHGHLAKVASNIGTVNLSAPPVGPVETMNDLVGALRSAADRPEALIGGWVIGRGYDPAFLREGRHPTRDDLDRASPDIPIYIGHVSGHLAVANSLALRMAGIDESTPNPPGGVIRRRDGSGDPDGVLEESAMGFFTRGLLPTPSPEVEIDRLREAQRIYAASGITTAQEGAMFPPEQALLERAASVGELFLDVVGYAFWAVAESSLRDRQVGAYVRRFKLGGMKLMLDGSPQGKTAWLSVPYHEPPPGSPPDYCGYPAMPDEQANRLVALANQQGWQVIAHCNGDASADQYLRAIRRAPPGGPGRPVMIHAQTVREDQLDAMAELGVLPSFFASHVYYWGDYHRDSVLGADRAARISPLRSALDRGIRFNLHNDSPVVPPDILRLVRCAVERRTRSGSVLGEGQRIGITEALRAVTIDAAYAHFEEEFKGSIAPGKLADLVILSGDPVHIPAAELESIEVRETMKEGTTIFAAER